MLHVPLEVPLALLALCRRREGDDAADPRVDAIHDPLDDTALARGIAPLEEDHHPETLRLDPVLHLHELELESSQLRLVDLLLDVAAPTALLVSGVVRVEGRCRLAFWIGVGHRWGSRG
jgi:hypothetical protein